MSERSELLGPRHEVGLAIDLNHDAHTAAAVGIQLNDAG